jgi:serine phosphatase RsbU (regulator of sigma subunit)
VSVNQFNGSAAKDFLRKEAGDVRASVQDFGQTVRETMRPPAPTTSPDVSGLMDPIRFKRFLVTLIKLLIVIELLSALVNGLGGEGWGQFGFDLIVAGILYLTWDKITTIVREKKEETARKMRETGGRILLWDALTFSLLWSDEIYQDIPADRRRLVVISFTLIALGIVAAFLKFGTGLMPLVIPGVLVLAAVNLLAWVVSSERDEKEELQTELKLAHDVQISLMPKSCPAVEGFDIAGQSVAAKEVGGDHFDFHLLGLEHRLFGINVFDVSGKGLHAAMSAVFTSGAFVSEVGRSESPADILTRLNTSIYRYSRRGHFVAMLFTLLDLDTKTLLFSNAGQTKPLLRRGPDVLWLDSNGVTFPLGMKEFTTYENQSLQLASGDLLLLLTDGLTEAMNTARETFGNERIEKLIAGLSIENLSAQQIVDAVTREIQGFAGSAPQHDDMTMVVVKVL